MRTILLTCIALATSAPLLADDVEIIAHRGASHVAPENTMASINLAWKRHADAVEIDIYLSKDGHIVLMHDRTTKRTGGHDEPIVEQTLAELRRLDVGVWKDEKYQGERIPVLKEVLPTIPEGGRLFIEIKTETEILSKLEEVIRASGVDHDRLVIICFDYKTIRKANAMFPEIECYWISSLKKDKKTGEWNPPLETLIKKAKAADVDGLDLQARPVIDAAYVEAVDEADLGMYVWTVDDRKEARRLADAGVDGITTNRPRYIMRAIEMEPAAAR